MLNLYKLYYQMYFLLISMLLCFISVYNVNGKADMSCNAHDLQALMVHLRQLYTTSKNKDAELSDRLVSIESYFAKIKDGGWSNWEAWGSCSVTCDGGIKIRSRNCTNPRPSPLARYCEDERIQVGSCGKTACYDGGWSQWGFWSRCSVTCGEGVRTQTRSCTNQRPSAFGNQCEGETIQISACQESSCPGVAFRSKNVKDLKPTAGQSIIFQTVMLNRGQGYNERTGKFRAPAAGTYLFSVQFCVYHGDANHDMHYAIVVENNAIQRGKLGDNDWDKCYTANTVGHLNRGDRAWVTCFAKSSTLFQNDDLGWNTFSGALLNT